MDDTRVAILVLTVFVVTGCVSTSHISLYSGDDSSTIRLRTGSAGSAQKHTALSVLTVDGTQIGIDNYSVATVGPSKHDIELTFRFPRTENSWPAKYRYLVLTVEPNMEYVITATVVQDLSSLPDETVEFKIHEESGATLVTNWCQFAGLKMGGKTFEDNEVCATWRRH